MKASKPIQMHDASAKYFVEESEAMVRTQLYLTKSEHAFVRSEASRIGQPMAAVIRRWIDEKMEIPESAWKNNPLLQPPAEDFDGPEDGSINHDHYIYGGPKKYKKVKGKWVLLPPLP